MAVFTKLDLATQAQSGSLTADIIATGAVTSGALGPGAVTSGAIDTGAVTSGAISANAVTSGAIANGAITDTKLSSGSINVDGVPFGSGGISLIQGTSITITPTASANTIQFDVVGAGIDYGKDYAAPTAPSQQYFRLSQKLIQINSDTVSLNGSLLNKGANDGNSDYTLVTVSGGTGTDGTFYTVAPTGETASQTGNGVDPLVVKFTRTDLDTADMAVASYTY